MTQPSTPITVLILSWNRPIYLWVCLDSLYRHTRHPARFVLIDNHSDDTAVRPVVEGFQRRGMFHAVRWEAENSSRRLDDITDRFRDVLDEYFAFIEGDVSVFETDPCWLTRMSAHMKADPQLALLGSYIDGRDFIDSKQAQHIAPDLGAAQRAALIKARSPERDLPLTPPAEPIIDPFNPPGRLLMLRTDLLDSVPLSTPDHELYQRAKSIGYRAGIATDVRHRHLSLTNLFDYPAFSTDQRDAYYASAIANRSQVLEATPVEADAGPESAGWRSTPAVVKRGGLHPTPERPSWLSHAGRFLLSRRR